MPKKKTSIFVGLFVVLTVVAVFVAFPLLRHATPLSSGQSVQHISVQQASQLIASTPDLIILDSRGEDEMKDGYISGSTRVNFWEAVKGNLQLDTTKPVLVYCAVGGRSAAVTKVLAGTGHPAVYDMQGGISAWKQAGLPTQYP